MHRTLIHGASILSQDGSVGDLAEGDILIEDDRIAAIAPRIESPDAAVIEAAGMIAMPGLVNTHIHTWQTGLRGIAADWTLGQYLRAMHAGLATYFTPEDIAIANEVGALHQLHAGTTTLTDWCHNNPTPAHTDAAVSGLMASGIRARFLHGSPKPDPKPGQPHFSEIPMPRSEVERLATVLHPDDLVSLGLAILGPQMSVMRVTETDFRLARELGLMASMHVSGTLMTPDAFEQLERQGLLGPHVNIVHGNALSDGHLDLLTGAGVTFSLTPEVELQMGFGTPLTRRVRQRGGLLALGTDIESGMAGDMFSSIRFALQSARHDITLQVRAETGAPPPTMDISTREALRWATLDGARLLGLQDKIGSLTPGKQADIILIDARGINLRPVHDPAASVLFHAGPRDVDTVLVAGRVRKRGGTLLVADLDAKLDRLAESGARIMSDFRAAQAAKG
jgi:5-methylthioadenosine/S-adenosylhomocysteine deaminase